MDSAVAEIKWWATLEERLVKKLCRSTNRIRAVDGRLILLGAAPHGSMCIIANQRDRFAHRNRHQGYFQ